MASTNPPDWTYSAFYYPEIYGALLQFKLTDFPEHTETNPHDPVVQLYRMAALGWHSANVRLDHVAREAYLPTARLRASFLAMAPLVDYRLEAPTPATVDVVVDIAGAVVGTATIIAAHSLWSTKGDDTTQPLVYEYDTDDDLQVTDTGAWLVTDFDGTATYTDIDTTGTWSAPIADDGAAYFGHADAMFDRIGIEFLTANSTIHAGVWEYYDDSREMVPDAVANDGSGNPSCTINTLLWGDVVALQDTDVANGADLVIRITCVTTGQYEDCFSSYSSLLHKVVATATSALGQATLSLNANDYRVQAWWVPLPLVSDGTIASSKPLGQSGTVQWTLPQASDRRWATTTINAREAYWIRFRVTSAAVATAPVMEAPSEPTKTTWSLCVNARQGERVEDRLGTSTGDSSQSWTLNRTPFVELVEVTVDGDAWSNVEDFLSSTTFDKHFTVIEQPDGTYVITFGDGTNGRIPALGAEVIATYRINADNDGNVGAGGITIDRSGNSKAKKPRNPRDGTGWTEREGVTAASRSILVSKIPAQLRTLDRAVTPDDYETLSLDFLTAAGDQVAIRAAAVEEGYGLKTMQVYVVGVGGLAASAADRTELQTYFNGADAGLQRVGGKAAANVQVTVDTFVPHAISVAATVSVLTDYADGADTKILAILKALLMPTAKRLVRQSDGTFVESTAYQWSWGVAAGTSKVSKAVLLGRIVTSVDGVVDVDLGAFADVVLAAGELPTNGTITVAIVEVS
jgi:hypothetical protein